MVIVIVSAVLSFLPAIIVGINVGIGWGILCYFVSLIAGILGFHIGKFLNNFVGDRFIITNGGFFNLVAEKFNALYGPQLTGFLLGMLLPALIFGTVGIKHNQSVNEQKEQQAIDKIVQTQAEDLDIAYLPGGNYFFASENNPVINKYKREYPELEFTVKPFGFQKDFVSKGLYGKIMGKDNFSGTEPYEHFSWYEAIVFCNKLSAYQNRTPCYSIKGSTNPEDWGEIPSGNSFAWDSVKCDFEVDGYRLPTVKEWCYANYGYSEYGLQALYGKGYSDWKSCANLYDIKHPDGDQELLWNWYSEDCSAYMDDLKDGDTRSCGLRDTKEELIYIDEINDSYRIKLRVVRNITEKELNNSMKTITNLDLKDLNINMILVEGGSFECGGDKEDELPKHLAEVTDFYMSSTVIPCDLAKYIGTYYNNDYTMTPYKLQLRRIIPYCNYLSVKSGLKPCYTILEEAYINNVIFDPTANGYRLPTEEEWEYAAKGGKNKENFKWAGSDDIEEVAWYKGNSNNGNKTKIATKKPNSLGFYDMSGLCSEWVWSGPDTIAVRYGDINSDYKDFTVLSRKEYQRGVSSDELGFRLARNK